MGRVAAGNLTERLSLLNPSAPVPDGRGGFLPGVATSPLVVRASVRQLSGLEVLRLGQVLGTSVVEFTIRYTDAVNTTTKLRWSGRSYGVRQVVHDPRREFTVLTAVDNGTVGG
ncbi:phage head closure protein [Hymenobacter psychrophilus]|uniref:Phage head-tail adaptor, putative, SPP1 family n=1 Tax=Hymenobacter psychrophilus TaxID=651662 RepID=A0A1H3P929_9BACT|nr:phage head closure protein [Hymenobacter psychrophilus]SDY97622.1 phage head-tail adaptor, putative, SPP1 family [Hymenobacter psychrophilus]